MRLFQQVSSFIIIAMLLASCAPANAVVGIEESIVQPQEVNPAPAQPQSTQAASPEAVETINECLNCHSDKDLLMETTDAVEDTAESESKGVG